MEHVWERYIQPACLRAARWLACPDRPVDPLKRLPAVDEVRSAFAVEDPEKVEEALHFCRWLFEREEERTRILESKAITLTGFAGVTTALVSGFAALLLDQSNKPCVVALAALLILYVFLAYSFVRTILCALMVVRVGRRYTFKYPASKDILGIKSQTVQQIRQQRAVDFFDSYANNRAINRDKAGYLISAQKAFAVAALLLLVIAVVIAGYMLLVALRPWLQQGLSSVLQPVSESIIGVT